MEKKQFAWAEGIMISLVLSMSRLPQSYSSEYVQETVVYTNLEFKRTHVI